MKRSERSSGRRGANRRLIPLGDVVVVATSGGVDSAAALLWTRAAAPHARIIACYVDHGVRPPESRARDVAAVRAQARVVGANVKIQKLRAAHAAGESREAQLRRLRYAALREAARDAGARFVVLGHHADDVAETLLLSMMRGSGLDGVAAMRRVRALGDGVRAVRPLLSATKRELEARVRSTGLRVSRDETNDDTSLRRNAVRALVASLEAIVPGASRAMTRSARLLRADARLMRAIASEALAVVRLDDGSLAADALARLPHALAAHVVRLVVLRRSGSLDDVSEARLRALLRALNERRGGRFELRRGVWADVSRGRLRIAAQTTSEAGDGERFVPRRIEVPARKRRWSTPLGELEMERAGERRAAGDLAVALAPGTPLELRTARPADTCVPSGRRRSLSLARFLSKCDVPRWQRERMAVLCDGGRIIAVLGVRAMEPGAAKGGEQSYIVRWRPIV